MLGIRFTHCTFAKPYTQMQFFVVHVHLSEVAKAAAAKHGPSCAITEFLPLKTDQICFCIQSVWQRQLHSERETGTHWLVRVLFVAGKFCKMQSPLKACFLNLPTISEVLNLEGETS
mmetsp:Transcript_5020/g.31991  ORF Transcript_5020/g.31991 Transcript_5020/m.31991 type:complete len:117 (-) Transcript_5020:37-387(-)